MTVNHDNTERIDITNRDTYSGNPSGGGAVPWSPKRHGNRFH